MRTSTRTRCASSSSFWAPSSWSAASSRWRPRSPRTARDLSSMPTPTERVSQASLLAGAAVLRSIETMVLRSSLVPTSPFLDPALLPWTAELESRWRDIREELDAVLVHHDALPNFQDISTDQVTITDDDRWKTYFLYGFGSRSDANCARCPRTAELVGRVPGMTTAFFSILSPG